MSTSDCCAECARARRLVRDGTSQEQRASAALDPSYAPVDEHTPAHRIVFAAAYSAFLRYVDSTDSAAGDWQRFFGDDVGARLALAAVSEVAEYRSTVRTALDRMAGDSPVAEKRTAAAVVFSMAFTLAAQLDALAGALPDGHPLRLATANAIRAQLRPAMRRLIAYAKAGQGLAVPDAIPPPNLRILGRPATTVASVVAAGLSADWVEGTAAWAPYYAGITPDPAAFGTAAAPEDRITHLATYNLFTSALEAFLGVYARVAADAEGALAATFSDAGHEPHYALFLAFVRLLEHARERTNTLTGRHLDFYYREILGLRERPAAPGHAHLVLEPGRHVVAAHLIEAGTEFKAGKDARGVDVFFAADRDVVVNRARIVDTCKIYRSGDTLSHEKGRVFAAPVAGSVIEPDGSWHPFADKAYVEGALQQIAMPGARIGFAIASHHLLLAGGTRKIAVTLSLVGAAPVDELKDAVSCSVTTEKGWLEKPATTLTRQPDGSLLLKIALDGGDPPVTGYVEGTHQEGLGTDLPVLKVTLRHDPGAAYRYHDLEGLVVTAVGLLVDVEGLRGIALSNDLGAVDATKPFQPFGPLPTVNGMFTIGSREAFQKHVTAAKLLIEWMSKPAGFDKHDPKSVVEQLVVGRWTLAADPKQSLSAVSSNGPHKSTFDLTKAAQGTAVDAPDLGRERPFDLTARHGFVRLRLDDHFGQNEYMIALIAAAVAKPTGTVTPPVIPVVRDLSLSYTATQTITFSPSGAGQAGRFFHLAPFGHAEQIPGSASVTLLPRVPGMDGAAELYVGVADLSPPQNLAVLAQIVDGTANPLTAKPPGHVQWSYLRGNEWVAFGRDAVDDRTNGLVASGIVTLAVPADATSVNTLLPGRFHWLRAAVAEATDAVCRVRSLTAQGAEVTYAPQAANDPTFSATVLAPGTIAKLRRPDAAVKSVAQPAASFGGRGAETPGSFATRVSERLRHKNRAIGLWDYERLVLEAFPSLYRVRCLRHTQYEPTASGAGVYRDEAPGHVTVVMVPIQHPGERRDPLRPYTSVAVLDEVEEFLAARMSCFARLHVRNPQFESVHLDFRVRLSEGVDETFTVNRLKDEITRFLSPWAYGGGGGPTFTGRFRRSALIDFVEERPYVDYVTDFTLCHRYPSRDAAGNPYVAEDRGSDEVVGSRAVSMLVSAPAAHHAITVIHSAQAAGPAEQCPCEVSSA